MGKWYKERRKLLDSIKGMPDDELNEFEKAKDTQFREAVKNKSVFNEKARGSLATSTHEAGQEFKRRGYEQKMDVFKKTSNRGHFWKKAGKTLKSLGPIGAAAGLAMSDDVSAAVDPSGSTSMDYDKAFEDPSSPEYAERISLIESLTGKKRKDK
jgi:hypothetical protein